MSSSITLKSLLETHDQPFAIIDASLKIVAVNRAYEEFFSCSRADLIGKNCCAVTGDEQSGNGCRHRQLFTDLEPYRVSLSNDSGDGHVRAFQLRGYPLIDSDQVIYLGEAITPQAGSTTSLSTAMAGRSRAFQKLREQLQRGARSQVPVLLEGETGTGKEVAAEFIHQNSPRHEKDLVVVDCTVLGEDLFESELFGHEKGAFTGAAGTRKGLFEMADQGTLFLDEIGELPLSQQPKLLRALESGTFRRVGGSEARRADVRVVSATNRNLLGMVRSGGFREDLYYRLAVLTVQVPPLRDRREDIEPIAQLLMAQISKYAGRCFSLTAAALRRLSELEYPGNIRELRNILQLSASLADQDLIDARHVVAPEHRQDRGAVRQAPMSPHSRGDLGRNPMEAMELAYITELLDKHRGNRRLVAAEMNVSERTLYRKLKRLQITD